MSGGARETQGVRFRSTRATYSNLHARVMHIAQQGDEIGFYTYNTLFVKAFVGTCIPPNGCATVYASTYASRSDSGRFRHQTL